MKIRIGSRESRLAVIQSRLVMDRIAQAEDVYKRQQLLHNVKVPVGRMRSLVVFGRIGGLPHQCCGTGSQ